MTAKIETYRGIEITFDTENESFICSFQDRYSAKQSYAACKKSIDDYLKDNAMFEPFMARSVEGGKCIKVIGIRKDGRWVYEEKGKKAQLSEYYESNYVIDKPEYDNIYAEIAVLELEMEALRWKVKNIKDGISGETLKELKLKYLQPA